MSSDCPPCPPDRKDRSAALLSALNERVLVLDGATGTALQGFDLEADDYGGVEHEGCHEILCAIRPDVVDKVHEQYLSVGCDVVETNSFGGTPLVLKEFGLEHRAFELNRDAALIAREACARHDTDGRLRFVCGSMGPTTRAISVTGGVTFAELQHSFRVQAQGLLAGGADYLLLETCQDTRNIKAGLLGIAEAFCTLGWSVPVAVSATIEASGTMLAGQDAEALAVSLLHADLLYLGLNCATGPELMRDHIRSLASLARARIACVPNAGLPDEEGCYRQTPQELSTALGSFLDEGWLNVIGGCCGTTPAHIAALSRIATGRTPRPLPEHHRALVSGIESVELEEENRPLLVGERTNVLGSRRFRRLIAEGQHDEAAEIGRAQVAAGAQILDVCLQDPDRDEGADVSAFLQHLVRRVRVPIMVDSTDLEVVKRALLLCQGKAVINSVNLEDGPERLTQGARLARELGAALVVGCIDEAGMAVTAGRKLEVAARIFGILTDEAGIRPEDIWWDPLVFPAGTGDEGYLGAAAETIRSITALKDRFPHTRTVMGISNVSFGLPEAGREVLNSVFLYRCTQAGLDAAIVNTQRLARYAEIEESDRVLAERLLAVEVGQVSECGEAVDAFAARFRDRDPRKYREPRDDLPVDERLSRAVVEGSKTGLEDALEQALADSRWPRPLDIINGPLLDGMAEVGRLFNENQLIVAEVLQSAEVMKAAVSFLEPRMERGEAASGAKVLLATVKGDVHDIGKNLVDILLSNNGFSVVNLGIKIASERLIQAVEEHRPDVLGLSGLLVKSAHQMVHTAGDLTAAGIDLPLLVGGAALSRKFVESRIAPAYSGICLYARDAMEGLSLARRLSNPTERAVLEEQARQVKTEEIHDHRIERSATAPTPGPEVNRDISVPEPPDLHRHVATLPLDEVWEYLNLQMLFAKHLGLKGSVRKLKEAGDPKYRSLENLLEELKNEARFGAMTAKAVWQFFPARGHDQSLTLFDPETGGELAKWVLPRQQKAGGLSIPDFVLEKDHVALFVTTAGEGVRDRVEAWKDKGAYLKSHGFAALALETAEAAAELVHASLREYWGFPDSPETSEQDRFSARYRGKRYSFGYPACPDLEGQRQLFSLLAPEDIGVRLTEGYMMDPEASVSAIVVHHPEARYFGV